MSSRANSATGAFLTLTLVGCATAPQITPVAGATDILLVSYADPQKNYYLVPAPYGSENLDDAQKSAALTTASRYCRNNLTELDVMALSVNKTRTVPAVVFQCVGGSGR